MWVLQLATERASRLARLARLPRLACSDWMHRHHVSYWLHLQPPPNTQWPYECVKTPTTSSKSKTRARKSKTKTPKSSPDDDFFCYQCPIVPGRRHPSAAYCHCAAHM
mmetsp:Transcript_14930/g.32399  ORF Transcript_14930/g.32399 Transcript_14930/m.32399 type:complete len:108 (-) Transcript_14930:141-464(-)